MSRKHGTKSDGSPFDDATVDAVWKKATPELGYSLFRRDACSASIQRTRYGERSLWGWEIDHIKPVSQGGTDDPSNLQPLQWENNRNKGDKWPDWDCLIRTDQPMNAIMEEEEKSP